MVKKLKKSEIRTYDTSLYNNNLLENVEVQEGPEVMKENMATFWFYLNEQRAIINDKDWLKPVHRRLLYTFHHQGLKSSSKFTKSAEITGTNMGLFHPHGDAYGSMIRLVQPEVLNIPLIEGQGNFWGLDTEAAACFTGDTKISLLDWRELEIESVIKEIKEGKTLWAYSFDIEKRKIVAGKIIYGASNWIKKIIEIEIDTGDKIRCTEDHKFLLHTGEYVEAVNLKEGDSLCPLYRDKDEKGYEFVLDVDCKKHKNNLKVKEKTHYIGIEYIQNKELFKGKDKNMVIHHQDFNKRNNNPENLIFMDKKEHILYHSKHYLKTIWTETSRKKAYENWIWKQSIEEKSKRGYKAWKKLLKCKWIKFFSEMWKKAAQKNWESDSYRNLMQKVSVENWKKTMKWLNEKQDLGMFKIKGSIRNIMAACYRENGSWENITEELFDRKANETRSNIRYKKAIQRFDNSFEKMLEFSKEYINKKINHKVVKITKLNEKQEVFDIEVEKYHNFALSVGVFVHNCRYTESKITKFAEDVLFEELKYKAIPIWKNYSGTVDEPEYFPAKLPLGLINSNMGIGYGLASNVPWFNINEIIQALIALIKNPEEDIFNYIKWPDFPSWWQIISSEKDLRFQIENWRGSIRVRGKIDINREQNELIITELPYMVSAQDVKLKILDLIESDKKTKINEVMDLSAQWQIYIKISYKKGVTLEKEKNLLFKKGGVETSIPFNFVVLKNNEKPKLFTVKEYLLSFIEFRKHCVKIKFEVQIAELVKRIHILEWLLKLQDKSILDDLINSIRNSEDLEILKDELCIKNWFSKEQIEYILWMKLASLSKISIKEISEEYEMKMKDKLEKENLLKNHLEEVIIKEWKELKAKYWQERKTIIQEEGKLENSDLDNFTENKPISIILTERGYIKSLEKWTFRTQRRGWKWVSWVKLGEWDEVKLSIDCMFHDSVYFITNKGKIYSWRGWTIPEGSRWAKWTPVQNFLEFKEEGETVEFMFSVNKEEKDTVGLVILYKNGNGYRVKGEVALRKRNGSRFVPEETEIASVFKVWEDDKYLVLGKLSWFANRLLLEEIPERQSVWGTWVKLSRLVWKNDYVTASLIVWEWERILTISGKGFGKLSELEDYRLTWRGSKWVKVGIKADDTLVAMHSVDLELEQLLKLVTVKGQTIVIDPSKIRETSRTAKGVKLFNLEDDVIKFSTLIEKTEDNSEKVEGTSEEDKTEA